MSVQKLDIAPIDNRIPVTPAGPAPDFSEVPPRPPSSSNKRSRPEEYHYMYNDTNDQTGAPQYTEQYMEWDGRWWKRVRYMMEQSSTWNGTAVAF